MTNWTELKRLAEEASWTGRWYDAGCNTVMCTYVDKDVSDHDEIAHPCPLGITGFIAAANPKTILALIAENERLRADGNDVFGLAQARADTIDQLRAEVEGLRNSLRQISNEVDCNMRPLIRDLVNRACGLDNGANPNDLYVDCDRIDEIIDLALDSSQ